MLASGAAIAFAYLVARIASRCKLFQDAPDCDPYLNRILGEIERDRIALGGGGSRASAAPLVTRKQHHIAHDGSVK